MLFLIAQCLLLAHSFAVCVIAHRDWWIQGLPNCWQDCLSGTEVGCTSRNCICKTTENSASYLPSAVSCAVSQCYADNWSLELVLGPLQLYCSAIDCAIPNDVMDSAYAAVSGTDGVSQTSRVAFSTTESRPSEHTTIRASDDGSVLKSTIQTTITRTTIDGKGNTLQVIVPIVMGPSGISTGATITSTVDVEATSTQAIASASASPSRTAGTAATQASSSTSAQGSQVTARPASGNGSPFENMQAAASQWSFPAPLFALACLTLLLVRL